MNDFHVKGQRFGRLYKYGVYEVMKSQNWRGVPK